MSGGKDALCEVVLREINKQLGLYNKHLEYLKVIRGSWSKVDIREATEFVTAGMALMRRVAGADSEFGNPAAKAFAQYSASDIQYVMPFVAGGLVALRDAVQSGYLDSLEELVHAEVFADFLEMAEYLLGGGYKDAAAVLIRGVLESHLRELCARKGVDATYADSHGKIRPKKVDRMNADLKRAGVYPTTDQKNVTSWYGLGTDAAHGHYTSYTADQVRLMLQSVTDFIARHPA